MITDFGAASDYAVISKSGKHPLLQIPSHRWPGTILEFMHKWGSPPQTIYYKCKRCTERRRQNPDMNHAVPPNISVKNGRIVTDPDFPKNSHFCDGTPFVKAKTEQIIRDIRTNLRRNRKRPSKVLQDNLAHLPLKFPDLDAETLYQIQQNLIQEIRRVAPGLRRLPRSTVIPPITDINYLPEAIWDSGILLYHNCPPDKPLIILSTNDNLGILRMSKQVVCQTDSKHQPQTPYPFYQLLCLHAFIQDESTPALIAILPDNSEQTYATVFNVIRSKLFKIFSDIGCIMGGEWNFELDPSALGAFGAVFPEATVYLSLFLYVKVLQQKLFEFDLTPGFHEDFALRTWTLRMFALSLVPEHLVLPIAKDLIAETLQNVAAHWKQKLLHFWKHFVEVWIHPAAVPVWNNFSNSCPRVSDDAEGWNSSLQAQFHFQHPDLAKFLNLALIWNNAISMRTQALMDGIAKPVIRPQKVIQCEKLLLEARDTFQRNVIDVSSGIEKTLLWDYMDYVGHLLHDNIHN